MYVNQIENSEISTLLSTKTSYNDDIRRQQDERRSDVRKSIQIKTVKLAKNVKITQEQLSMRQPQAAPPMHLILLIYRPRKDERLSWLSWLTCSGWFTHISGHPSSAGRAQDRKSSPVRPTFYHCATPPTRGEFAVKAETKYNIVVMVAVLLRLLTSVYAV